MQGQADAVPLFRSTTVSMYPDADRIALDAHPYIAFGTPSASPTVSTFVEYLAHAILDTINELPSTSKSKSKSGSDLFDN